MILRRLTANLHAQNWTAIAIDFVIVVIGVFLGIQASNWNQARLERRGVNELLAEMRPEVSRMRAANAARLNYYHLTDGYAREALAGWGGHPQINDRDFVVAAYQASQITASRSESPLKALLSSEDIRKIDDPALRWALLRIMNFTYDAMSASAMQSRYREDVRQTIPADIQAVVRQACGDRALPNGILVLPPTCGARIAPDRASAAATELRNHPELSSELQFHLAQAANFELNTIWLDQLAANLQKLLDAKFKTPS